MGVSVNALKRFFTAFDRKRHTAKSGIWIGAHIEVLHRYRCPASRSGKSNGPCDCGGLEQKREIADALEALREFAK